MSTVQLRRFMVERLLDLDPTLDDSASSEIYSKVVDPVVNRLGVDPLSVDIEAFIIDRIQSEFPSLDVTSPGSVIRDVLVSPLVLILEPLQREIQFLKTQQSLADRETLTEAELDALLSNVFSTRNYGDFARTKVRVFFNSPHTVSVDQSIVFSDPAGIGFVPEEPYVYSAADMTKLGNLYYLDIDVRSQNPELDANVAKGAIRYVRGLDDVVRITNLYTATGGITKETNEEFLDRAERSLSERSLNSARGIETTIFNNFSDILSIDVVGFGEAEMMRDVVQVRVSLSEDSRPGALTFMTADWRTHGLVDDSDSIIFPVTNTIVLTVPTIGWRADQLENMANAKFIRITDGLEDFSSRLLGRLRSISSIEIGDVDEDVYIKVDDFEVYPERSALSDQVVPTEVRTNGDLHGFNAHPWQGSQWKLAVSDDAGTTFVVGAPLPVSDNVGTDYVSGDVPTSVSEGRDFLVTYSTQNYTDTHKLSTKIRAFPLSKYYSASDLGVSRSDGFLVSRDRVPLFGIAYEFDPAPEFSVLRERLSIVDFGAPAYEEEDDNIAKDGETVGALGRNPGVGLEVMEPYPSELVASDVYAALTHPTEVDIILSSSQVSWASRGVQVGDFVACALFGTKYNGNVTAVTADLEWYGWGRVIAVGHGSDHRIRVQGLDWTPLYSDYVDDATYRLKAHDGSADAYLLSWVVYKGAVSSVSPSGSVFTSFTDFSFPPAYRGLIANRSVAAHGILTYQGCGWKAGNLREGSLLCWSSSVTNVQRGVWIRLGQSLAIALSDMGYAPARELVSGEFVNFTEHPPWVLYSLQCDYSEVRYDTLATDRDLDGSGADPVLFHRTILPLMEGFTEVHNADFTDEDDLTVDTTATSFANSKGLSGFLIPHPMGTGSYAVAPWSTPGNNITDDELLDHQVVQLFDEQGGGAQGASIVVSGIPGSVPFPGAFGGEFSVENNQFHIGGMTDVYIKPSSYSTDTTEGIALVPETIYVDAEPTRSPDESSPIEDVLLVAVDGVIDSDTSPLLFYSADLATYLESVYGVAPQTITDLAIELLDVPDPTFTQTRFSIIHSTSGGARIGLEFPSGLSFTDLRFRLVQSCTTSITNPITVLHQGADLVVRKNELVVYSAGGFPFEEDPELVDIYLSIDNGDNYGEYSVVSVAANTITLDRVTQFDHTGASFRVYTKQGGGVAAPFVRVSKVALSGDDAGVVIPYKHPVDIIATDFSGLNDDPVTDEDLGVAAWSPTLMNIEVSGEGRACLVIDEVDDFENLGIITYDVVKIDGVDEADKYWYVTDFGYYITTADSGSLEEAVTISNVLILDRAMTTGDRFEDVSFTAGHPALGRASVVFKDRTYFKVDQNTVFYYEDEATGATVKFRPSPAEEGVVFEPETDTTSAYIAVGSTEIAGMDFFSNGVKIGDTVQVLSRVLRSTSVLATTTGLNVAGKTLTLLVDDVRRSVTFSGSNPVSLTSIVGDINRQLSGVVRATVDEDFTDPTCVVIALSSSSHVQLVNYGSSGILTLLGFITDIQKDNGLYTTDLIDSYAIDGMNYDEITDVSSVSCPDIPAVADEVQYVFVRITRASEQIVYPADMTELGTGLYSVDVRLTSYDPNVTGGLISDEQQLMVSDYYSLGYELIVRNTNYSYSSGEQTSISVTPIMLDELATSVEGAYTLAGASVLITYDAAPTVESVQSFMLSPVTRVVCNNPLVRHFLPAYPLAEITFRSTKTEDEISALVSSHLSGLYPNKPLEIFGLTSVLGRNGVSYMEFPQRMSFLTHDESRRLWIVRDNDVIRLNKRFHMMEDMTGVVFNKVV